VRNGIGYQEVSITRHNGSTFYGTFSKERNGKDLNIAIVSAGAALYFEVTADPSLNGVCQ
jgi:hypothetical protein